MTINEALDYLNQYKNAGNHIHREAMDMAIGALEKQIPKKPIIINYGGRRIPYCPICKELLIKYADEDYREIFGDDWRYMNHCDDCGQRIDWSDGNDDKRAR